MREATSGTTLPKAQAVWLNAAQGLATNTAYAPAHIALPNAKHNNCVIVVTARGPLPATAGGCDPTVTAFCDADNFVTLKVSNNNANALVALGAGADVTFDIMAIPINP